MNTGKFGAYLQGFETGLVQGAASGRSRLELTYKDLKLSEARIGYRFAWSLELTYKDLKLDDLEVIPVAFVVWSLPTRI